MKPKTIVISLLLLFLFSCVGLVYSLGLLHPAAPVIAVVAQDKESRYRIVTDPEDRSLTAAAKYLAYAVKRSTGAMLELCDPSAADGASPCFFLAIDTEAQAADGGAYALQLDPEENIRLLLPSSDNAFAVVKTLCDTWLSPDCGIRENGALWLDQGMIDSRLMGLDCTLSGTLRILTQNILTGNADGGNSRLERAPRFTWMVHDFRPDIIGMQEVSKPWVDYLKIGLLYQYEFFGQNRSGSDSEDEWGMILYRRDRFKLLDGGSFWLSDTPEVAASKYPDSLYPRICTWVLLKDLETGQVFYFENTHLHHAYSEDFDFALRQLEVLFEEMDKVYDRLGRHPVFLVGDFNRSPQSDTYRFALSRLRDARVEALRNSSRIDYTYHNFGRKKQLLDHCFYQGDQLVILDYHIVDESYGGYISDHYGVLTEAFFY